jgi:hypothetical protein
VAESVIAAAFFGVRQDRVGLRDFLEALLGGRDDTPSRVVDRPSSDRRPRRPDSPRELHRNPACSPDPLCMPRWLSYGSRCPLRLGGIWRTLGTRSSLSSLKGGYESNGTRTRVKELEGRRAGGQLSSAPVSITSSSAPRVA